MLIRFGADPSMKCIDTFSHEYSTEVVIPEVKALRRASGSRSATPQERASYRESARLLKDARLLRPRLRGVFALRALCNRGRAWPTPETPAAFARLIGGRSRPRTRAAANLVASPGLPDPLAHLVCKFWLGEPPRRRRAAPATE